MKKATKQNMLFISFFISVFFCGSAQELDYNKRINNIGKKIQEVAIEQRKELKTQLDSINNLVETNVISESQAEDLKVKYAEESIHNLNNELKSIGYYLKETIKDVNNDKLFSKRTFNDLYNFEESNDSIYSIDTKDYIGGRRTLRTRRNTFSSFLDLGMSNLLKEGSFYNTDIKYSYFTYYQVGIKLKTRLRKNSNLLYLRTGAVLEGVRLKPTDERYFVRENNQTVLGIHEKKLDKSDLMLTSFQIPLYLEFDFTPMKVDPKTGKSYFQTDRDFRFGVGGYVNFSPYKGRQVFKYKEDGNKYRVEQSSNLHINSTRFGIGGYVGYNVFALNFKYELTPLFKGNTQKQNVLSMGLSIDI